MKNIGLLGLGTVGSGVYDILENRKDVLKEILGEEVRVKKILTREEDLDTIPSHLLEIVTTDFQDILGDSEIDVVIEVTGAFEQGLHYILESLKNRIPVVTANKSVVSKYFEEINAVALETDTPFLYEASVGGAIPIIKPLREELPLNEIDDVEGILNGTCNYILTRMIDENLDYITTLEAAQDLGYAERNPSADVDGFDTQRKLRILSTIAFRGTVTEEDIFLRGISAVKTQDIAYIKQQDATLKLIARATLLREGEYIASVEPTIVGNKDYFASVNMAFNSISFRGNHVSELKFYGEGAGKLPTGDAVLRDVIDILTGSYKVSHMPGNRKLVNKNDEDHGAYYLRISGNDSLLESLEKEYASSAKTERVPHHLYLVFEDITREKVYGIPQKNNLSEDDYFIARIAAPQN